MFGEGEPVDEFTIFLKEVTAKFPDLHNFALLSSAGDEGWQERLGALKDMRSGDVVMLYLPMVRHEDFVKALRAVEGFDCWRSSVHKMADKGVVFWARK